MSSRDQDRDGSAVERRNVSSVHRGVGEGSGGLLALNASELLQRFRSGVLSPVEYLEAVLARIEQLDPAINAVTELLLDEARAAARAAEADYLERGRADQWADAPPLLGLPIAAKEKHAIGGRTLSQGLRAHARNIAPADCAAIERIRAAGGLIHARTTSPEFSCATFTHSPLWGVTRNPWDLRLSPGGSSGGSGAALAAGYAPLATASDIAGSTRIPAGFTGTVGYKAPYGRVPGAPPLSADWYRGDGPMGRSVADVALLTSVMAGRDVRDHSSLPDPLDLQGWLAASDPGQGVRGVRIGLSERLGDYPVHPDVAVSVRRVARALEACGAVIKEVTVPWTTELIRETSFTHFGYILAPAMRQATAGQEDDLADYTLQFMADAEAAAARHSFYDGLVMEAQIQQQLAAAMRDVDVLLCPVSAVPGLAAEDTYLDGIDVPDGPGGSRHLEHYWEAHMTSPFNIANRVPVLAVPAGTTATGTPLGVQIVGHPYADRSVFRVGAAVEQALPWQKLAPVPASTAS